MVRTKRKLAEAQYFLGQLDYNSVHFDFIFSAFVSAARSVLWVMSSEFNGNEEWKNWFDSLSTSEKESELLKQTNNLRVKTTKTHPIKTEYYFLPGLLVDEESYPKIQNFFKNTKVGTTVELTIRERDGEERPGQINVTVKFEADESASRDALLVLAKDYFSFLDKVVEECSNRFTSEC